MPYPVVIFGVVLVTLIFMVTSGDADNAQYQQELYCEMVQTHRDTGGEFGWPDFRRNAIEVCR